MTYSVGMLILLLFFIAIYVAYEIATSPPSRAWIRKMQQVADGRAHQQAQWLAAGCWYGPKKDPLTKGDDNE